jgi:hypothetical protein
MVNIDLSKVLPSRAHEYLVGLVPGLFFVLSLAIGNPDLIARLAANSARSLTLGPFVMLGATLFLAFVIGNGFILVVSLIQYLFGFLYQFKLLVYRLFCKWPLQQITRWLLTKPRWQRPWLGHFNTRVVITAAVGFQDWRRFTRCWFVLARRLLRVRYGMEPRDLKDGDWEVLYRTLGTVKPEEIRGSSMMIACHATGWAGLVATQIAPFLRNKYYIGFDLFLIFNGLLHDYYVAKIRVDPRLNIGLAIRAVLRDFPKPEPHSEHDAESDGKI